MPESVTQSVTRALTDPSWGPVGSRLQAEDPELYKQMKALDEGLLALERARKSVTESVTRTCVGCGVEFQPLRPNHRYHANACRQAAYRAGRQG